MVHFEDSSGRGDNASHQIDAPISWVFRDPCCPSMAPSRLGVAERHQGPSCSLRGFLIDYKMSRSQASQARNALGLGTVQPIP